MKHLKENNETYLSHLVFAGKIGTTLILRGFVFILHALIPVYRIPKKWNLTNIISDLKTWERHTIRRKKNK